MQSFGESEASPRGAEAAARRKRGITVWFTGLPGAGKTTLSLAVEAALLGSGRLAYRLDGDELRRTLCSDLGFDRAARSENVRRAAYVAQMLSDAGLTTLVALISPYSADREAARALHEQSGIPFFEVFLDTPVSLCQQRDPKGLYGKAQQGTLEHLTGIDDPYERPADPDLRLSPQSLEQSVQTVLATLAEAGQIGG